jgi:hypothetical protein
MNDRGAVAAQLGREPRSVVNVVVRCPLDLPVVIKVPPHLDDGTPFPTTFWLTCPLAVRRIGRIEASGGVKRADARIAADESFAARHRAAAERYSRERAALVADDAPVHQPSGGVGGSQGGVKCLHAHYADYTAGNDNPVGKDTASGVGLLNCVVPCVVDTETTVVRNPAWVEPRM